MITIYRLSMILACVFNFIIGSFVYLKNKNENINRFFGLYCVILTFWVFGCFIESTFNDKFVIVLADKLLYTGCILAAPVYLNFCYLLTKKKDGIHLLKITYLVTALWLSFNYIGPLRKYFIIDVIHKYPFRYVAIPNFMWFVFIGWFNVLVIYSFMILFLYFRNQTGHEKTKAKYMLIAFFVMILAGSFYFLLLLNIVSPPIDPYLLIIYGSIMAYAILRHQLMGIEVIIKKTLVFAGLLASVFAILVLPTLLIQEYIFRGAGAGGRLLGLALSGVIIILSLRRIEIFLMNITDKYLFQKKYDYRELLRTFTSEVLTVVNLDKLVNLTVDKLTDIVKIDSSAVLLLNEEKQQFDIVASRNTKNPKVVLIRPDGIVTFLEQTHGYLLKKELIERRVYIPHSIQEIIDKLNAELIIPMVLHSDVMGILSLGKKKSDEDYTQDDLDILLPLARTLAIAISNARLFSELGRAQAEAAQREKMAVIGTLSAGINHEICNPLGIARGQCEAFLLNVKDGLYNDKSSDELLAKAKDIMAKVIKETDRATAITKKLSSFAKPAKGEAELVNINKEIDDVLGLVGYELKLDKIEFEKQIEKGLPDMFVDKKQLQEVLFNLIRNAGQAIGEKGKITVTARQDGRSVFIEIKDTGSGIPEDKLKELFNPFFTTKEPGKGTGLGLFIVRQVVEKNGGKIYLKETKMGEGTTFTVEFPLTEVRKSRV